MATNYLWKVWLRLNALTGDVDNDYIAEVSTSNTTRRNEDIAQSIVDGGSEIKYDTLLSVLNQRDRIVREMLQKGESVLTGCCQFTPRVNGNWIGSNAKYDSSEHDIVAKVTASAEMREALTEVGVEVLGVKEDGGAYIGLVTDAATGDTDGSITADDDVTIEGNKIKIAPDDEDGIGVFFVNSEGTATQVTHRLTQNDPKTVIARVPSLTAGEYTLRIITRFSNSSTLLKEARTIEYTQALVVS